MGLNPHRESISTREHQSYHFLKLQCSLLCLKSPEYYDPVRKKENALRRRNVVMYSMVKNEKLSESQYQELKEQPIALTSERIGGARSIAPHFMEYLRQQLEAMADKYGYNLYMDGLNIYTTT